MTRRVTRHGASLIDKISQMCLQEHRRTLFIFVCRVVDLASRSMTASPLVRAQSFLRETWKIDAEVVGEEGRDEGEG